MKHSTLNFWIEEEDLSQTPTQEQPQTPPAQEQPSQDQAQAQEQTPQTQEQPQAQEQPDKQSTPDVGDQLTPDMPEEKEKEDNFEMWKMKFFKDSINSSPDDLIESISQVRDDDLDAYQRKFVEDNLQILFLKQNANIEKANKELRKLINSELDENNPSVSLVNHFDYIFKKNAELLKILIKIKGTLGMKGDLHRKYLSSLLGAVQVGSGAENEDIIYNDTNYSIKISTRFNEKWGKIDLGKWFLKNDDPEKYLDESEIKRLEEGSPEEKEVLRKRIIIDAISELYKERSFLANIVGSDGTVYLLGIDLNSCLSSGYNDGKILVKFLNSEGNECSFDVNGNIAPVLNIKINLAVETDSLDENGMPKKEELNLIEKINGNLFFTSSLDTLKKAISILNGISLKEFPYTGNPSDLMAIQRCIPSASEILMRFC